MLVQLPASCPWVHMVHHQSKYYVCVRFSLSYVQLSAPKSQRFCYLRVRCPSRTPEFARFLTEDKAMLHCDLRVRWKVASDLRFGAAISEPETRSFCGISGDLTPSMQKSLAIAIQSLCDFGALRFSQGVFGCVYVCLALSPLRHLSYTPCPLGPSLGLTLGGRRTYTSPALPTALPLNNGNLLPSNLGSSSVLACPSENSCP